MKLIYLDNAATTAVDSTVFKLMEPYFLSKFGNASQFYALGQESKNAVEEARKKIAVFFGANYSEIIFTGSATESINLAHKGLIEALRMQSDLLKPHIITSSIEHKAVLETCKHLEEDKLVEVTYLPVDQNGLVDIHTIEKAVKKETVLVSLMYVNNEVGTVQDISGVGKLLKKLNKTRKNHIYFHTDATQAIQYLDCKVTTLGVDLLSFSGHKIYAPKGVGSLYIRKGTPMIRQVDGGGQEFGLRAGTENVPYIVALGKAVEKIDLKASSKINNLCKKLIKEILRIPSVALTGHSLERAPHIASFIVSGVEGESMILRLSDKGIMAATGSACNSNDLRASHVLTAMGFDPEKSHGSLRFSLGKNTTEEEIDYVIKILPDIIKDLRIMAPDF